MKRLRILAFGLAVLPASCLQDGQCAEGVTLIFLCDQGVKVTHGAKEIPAVCVYDFDEKSMCSPDQEASEMLQFQWDEEVHNYVLVCIPKCQKWHAEDALCYETCEATAGQKGVNCIRGHGNQWLLEDSTQTTCE